MWVLCLSQAGKAGFANPAQHTQRRGRGQGTRPGAQMHPFPSLPPSFSDERGIIERPNKSMGFNSASTGQTWIVFEEGANKLERRGAVSESGVDRGWDCVLTKGSGCW